MRSLANTILYGTRDDVAHLLDEDEDIHALDEYGYLPLSEAAIAKKLDIAELLLTKGAAVNDKDAPGTTALHWACDNDDLAMADLLLRHGADPNAYAIGGHPVLTYPLLRKSVALRKLLQRYGGNIDFAKDFINTKLLGHRFELTEETHIATTHNNFILVNFEGFYFQFTSEMIRDSLLRFRRNFQAKRLARYFGHLQKIIDMLQTTSHLLKFQHFNINPNDHRFEIENLLAEPLLLLPIAYEGHAITLLRYRNLVVKCDRGEYGRKFAPLTVYMLEHPERLNYDLLRQILYGKNEASFVHHGINDWLGLEQVLTIPLSLQITGNCSWANVEGAIPGALTLLLMQEKMDDPYFNSTAIIQESLDLFYLWHEWDKDRALEECIQSFELAGDARRATKVIQMAAILAYRCDYKNPVELNRARKIVPFLRMPEYNYILQTYLRVYRQAPESPVYKNLMQLLDMV